MRNFERRPRTLGDTLIRLLILLLAAMLLLALQITGSFPSIKGIFSFVTTPMQLGATGATENATNFVDFLLDLRTLRQRNVELEQRNSSLESQVSTLKEIERENRELRQFFAFAKARPGLELRGAQIIGRSIAQVGSNFLRSITVDLGARHGIEVGMPVVTDQGLVGRISEVRESTSDILLIDSVNSFINVILQSSRLTGVLRGEPGGDLIIDYIAQGGFFSQGELVLTSGLGGNFPKGIPIGAVVEIRQRDVDVLQQAVIDPVVDFNRLELVMIVTSFNPAEVLPDSLAPSGITPQATPTVEAAAPPAPGGG